MASYVAKDLHPAVRLERAVGEVDWVDRESQLDGFRQHLQSGT